jgi:2-amino-4-hydroxy-6-hydroxymethyldihydropteridine diphosphokinase
MNEAYLCLGGNLGNCKEIFAKCLELMALKGIVIERRSAIYISPAWGMENAPDFYNQVVKVNLRQEPGDLLQILLGIEKELGRERSPGKRYESRTIDLDILFFNSEVIDTEELHVPHPRLHLRRFVLEPMHEIAPGLVHPVLKKTIAQLLKECPDASAVKRSGDAS